MQVEGLDKVRLKALAVRAARVVPGWIVPAVKAMLMFADVSIAIASFLLAFHLRQHQPIFARLDIHGFAWSKEFAPYGAVLLLAVPIRLLMFLYYRLYKLRGEFSYLNEAARVFKATTIGSLLIVALTFLYRGGFAYRNFSYSRGVFVLDFLLALAAFGALRLLARGAQSVVRKRNINLIPTLVVGRGAEAALCIKEMRARPALGYRVVGVIENGALDDEMPEEFEGVPVLSGIEQLPEAISETRAQEVIITDPQVAGDLLFDVMMRVGRRQRVEFRIAPSFFNCLPQKTGLDQIGALPIILLFREPLSDLARIVKRTSDIIIASLAFAVLMPLGALIALFIKLDSRGPVFYRQERVGMDGRVFLFFKFRTMRAGTDDAAHREFQRKYITGQPESNLGDEYRPAYKLRADERVTRIGRLLRKTSLDELPQLFNVLRGDMSVVGPRPPISYEVESYQLWHRKRLDMKPGITGLWQVSGRNRLSFEEMVRMDLYYIENWSLLLDLEIILQTLPVMWRGEDAY